MIQSNHMSKNNGKKANFIRLAESRTNKAINYIELIGNLSNRNYYDYTSEQVDSIFNAIQSTLKAQKRKYDAALNKKRKFRLKKDGTE